MKALSLLKAVNDKIERWLHKEEYDRMSQEGVVQVTPEQAQMIEQARQQAEQLKKVVEDLKSEDHSIPPTEADIDRYYEYHKALIQNVEFLKSQGAWLATDHTLMEKSEFEEKASTGGWIFLRESVGLPTNQYGVAPKSPWSSASGSVSVSAWDDKEKWDTK